MKPFDKIEEKRKLFLVKPTSSAVLRATYLPKSWLQKKIVDDSRLRNFLMDKKLCHQKTFQNRPKLGFPNEKSFSVFGAFPAILGHFSASLSLSLFLGGRGILGSVNIMGDKYGSISILSLFQNFNSSKILALFLPFSVEIWAFLEYQ